MLAIRAGNVNEIYEAKATRRTILDIVSFSGDMYCNIAEYNLLVDITAELQTDSEELLKPAASKFESLFKINGQRFRNYLMNKIVRLDGQLLPISRWTKIHRPDHSEILKQIMAGNEVDCEEYCRTKYTYGEEFETYANELYDKNCKINCAIAIVEARRQNANVGTICGLNMKRGKWNKNSHGVRAELEAIKCMKSIGYDIRAVSRLEKNVDELIKVSGVPDGYIEDAPIAEHRGIYLEIKSKPYRLFSKVDEYQLYTYWFLGGKPILLVNHCANKIEYRLYSENELRCGWDSIVSMFLVNAHRLANILSVTTLNKYSRLLRIMNNGGSKLTDKIAF